jgi:PAS domain-containing protein
MKVLPELKTAPELTGRWWKRLFEASPDAQVVCRPDGGLETINPRAARLFNLDPACAEGISVFRLLSPPADEKLAGIWERGLTRADTLHSVSISKGGSQHSLVDLDLVPLGEGFALFTFKEASRRLRLESHVQRLVTAIDATPDVFFVTDASLRITFVNPAFQTTTGYSIEEVLGRSDEFLRAPSEIEKVRAYHESAVSGQEWCGEIINRHRDGST